ncbi:MAG: septum formation protein Maf [Clostridiales bacterium]|nr:septum formation protein Maf [Clostridiales bacterium]
MLILASNSPRRKEILELMGLEFKIIPAKNETEIPNNIPIKKGVEKVAFLKAQEVFEKNKNATVIGADTVVVLEDEILGKPKNKKDAFSMLKKLSGKEHQVITGVAIISKEKIKVFFEKATVLFAELTENEINQYISTNEPMDKAGSYAVQGIGAKFVKKINGDFYTVMGLPCQRLYEELKKF